MLPVKVTLYLRSSSFPLMKPRDQQRYEQKYGPPPSPSFSASDGLLCRPRFIGFLAWPSPQISPPARYLLYLPDAIVASLVPCDVAARWMGWTSFRLSSRMDTITETHIECHACRYEIESENHKSSWGIGRTKMPKLSTLNAVLLRDRHCRLGMAFPRDGLIGISFERLPPIDDGARLLLDHESRYYG